MPRIGISALINLSKIGRIDAKLASVTWDAGQAQHRAPVKSDEGLERAWGRECRCHNNVDQMKMCGEQKLAPYKECVVREEKRKKDKGSASSPIKKQEKGAKALSFFFSVCQTGEGFF